MSTTVKSYIVTEDLAMLMKGWCATSERRFKVPSAKFFRDLRNALVRDLQNVAFNEVQPDGLRVKVDYLDRSSKESDVLKRDGRDKAYWIALDDVYINDADSRIYVTRIYNRDKHRLGAGRRPEIVHSIETQIKMCGDQYRRKGRPAAVVLADDGAYQGDTIVDILKELDKAEVFVTDIRIALVTLEGQQRINQFFESRGEAPPKFHSGMSFARERNLLDWVCERDFYCGVPRSGRTAGQYQGGVPEPFDENIGHPYILPLGAMEQAASIPKGQDELSARLLAQSIRLWKEVEKVNPGLKLTVKELPRFPGPGYALVFDEVKDRPVIDYLTGIFTANHSSKALATLLNGK